MLSTRNRIWYKTCTKYHKKRFQERWSFTEIKQIPSIYFAGPEAARQDSQRSNFLDACMSRYQLPNLGETCILAQSWHYRRLGEVAEEKTPKVNQSTSGGIVLLEGVRAVTMSEHSDTPSLFSHSSTHGHSSSKKGQEAWQEFRVSSVEKEYKYFACMHTSDKRKYRIHTQST